jgi:RHS repeat-associated protein
VFLLISTQVHAQNCSSVSPTSVTIPQGGGNASSQIAATYIENPGCSIYPAINAELSVQSCHPANCIAGINLVSVTPTENGWIFIEEISASVNSNCGPETATFVSSFPFPSPYVTATQAGLGGPSCAPVKSNPGVGNPNPSNPQATTAEPISTGNGNYFYQHVDLSLLGRPSIAFTRTYNAQDQYSGPLGTNWTHSYNIQLGWTSNGAVVKWGDGHTEGFTRIGASYEGLPGVTDTLSDEGGIYVNLIQKDGSSYLFTPFGKLIQATDRAGALIRYFSYDQSWNLTQVSTGSEVLNLTYDATGHISQVADNLGRTVSYTYDANGNLISATDAAAGVTRYSYDSNNRLISITLPDGSLLVQNTYDNTSRVISQSNARGYTTTLAYNTPAAGQTTITDPLGNKTIHTYDGALRITGVTDSLRHTTSLSYDASNNVIAVQDPRGNTSILTHDSLGNLLTFTDPLGNKALFTYNSFSEPLTVTSPKGKITSLIYDAFGDLTTVQDALGNKTNFTYNSADNLSSEMDARGNVTNFPYGSLPVLPQITDPLGNNTIFAYDAIGRLISVTDPNGHTTSVAYDALSHIISVTDPLSNETLFAYNTVGNLTKVTDGNGHATSYSYDAAGNLTQVTDALGHKTSYTYNKNNNRIQFVNAKGKFTTYTYNSVNLVTKVADPLLDATSYGYDPVGNVTSVTDANGKQSKFTYDKDNRLTKIAYFDGATVTYTYDRDSNRNAMVDVHGKTSYSYDTLDRVLSVVFPGASTVQYAYDPVGNRSSVKYPDGRSVTYTYDADNRVSEVTDWLSQVTRYSYDPASNPAGVAYPNKVTSAFSYDAANRLIGIVDSNGGAFRTLSYALDKVGNRRTVTGNSVAANYAYDVLNQLLGSATGTAKTSWTYDAVGNRVKQTENGVVTNYTYDSVDRMLTEGTTTFTYDKNGNRLAEATSSGTITNSYDLANRLISSAGPTGTSSFSYDGDGNRITQTTPAGTYIYSNDIASGLPVVLNEQGPDGTINYAYGLGLTESSSSAFNYFYSLDGLGSVSNLTDAKGTVQETYSYDAWGNALTATGSAGTKNKFRFTGQALDPATGLYFLRARHYDPSSGRFLTKDPLGFSGGDVNLYRYVRNQPTNLVDPFGLWTVSLGLTVNFNVGSLGINFSAGVVTDNGGNVGMYLSTPYHYPNSVSSPGISGFGGNIGWSVAGSNAVGIFDLCGPFVNGSIGGGTGGNVTVDAFGGSSPHGPVIGGGGTFGYGVGEHSSVSVTQTNITSSGGRTCPNEGTPQTK